MISVGCQNYFKSYFLSFGLLSLGLFSWRRYSLSNNHQLRLKNKLNEGQTNLNRSPAVGGVLAVADHGPQVVVVDLLDVVPGVLVHLDELPHPERVGVVVAERICF